ncbi:hypothetical protein M378DRAFT_18387 [Amanita muscaria Koide BX008]|uniref:Uncharacterized protein n=1 Tax=Amanita muscaria (strain Koide BX008) TaxID=946122 RepID=A0A0C2WEF1_AMAMK|nr:hypothetical protein M378DRAFT_18387 [Amanita muscaria Koide BX008]
MSSTEGASASMHADPPRDTRQTEKQKELEEEVLTANEILQMFRESTIQISQMRATILELTTTIEALQAAPAAAPAAQPVTADFESDERQEVSEVLRLLLPPD